MSKHYYITFNIESFKTLTVLVHFGTHAFEFYKEFNTMKIERVEKQSMFTIETPYTENFDEYDSILKILVNKTGIKNLAVIVVDEDDKININEREDREFTLENEEEDTPPKEVDLFKEEE
tara:strand:+ start:2191 stop:2550 length:360 start_codon:yes stop_codon:yes gene_type:complete